jgi:hypothetical protein
MAYEMLDGFGDISLGEWTQDRPLAFHLRRRLSGEEEKRVGAAIDCRNTEEGKKRFEEIKNMLPPQAIYLAKLELSGAPL